MKTAALDPEDFSLPPLHQAARDRDVDGTKLLLASGADVNQPNPIDQNGEGGNTPLWFAAQGLPSGGVPVARLLLQAGADINAPGEFGMTPMHLACSWGHAAMVAFLHEHGARLDLRDHHGRTPPDIAHHDYQTALDMPQDLWPEDFETWLAGMSATIRYLEGI